jgi:choline kinase
MKAIVLSAGQGKRLLPLTARNPKCLLPVDGDRTVLGVQLEVLARCGFESATVVVGFGAASVERFLREHRFPGLRVSTLFNPFYAVSDNLATCWLARDAMQGDFVLLNGDTIFEERVIERLLDVASTSVTVTIDHKEDYDADDMKVSIDEDGRLLAVGKALKPEIVNGESIGMLRFCGDGPARFRAALERTMREPEALRAWYLSVVNELAQETRVGTASVRGFWWREIDSPEDLEEVRSSFPRARITDGARLSAVSSGP